MSLFTGFAELRTPADLLLKLEHDIKRMSENTSDEYAAFDFFVTAEHVVDWLHSGFHAKREREALRQSDPLLQITSHIANGAKHFTAGASHHKSVAAIERGKYADDYADDYADGPIFINFSEGEVAVLACDQIDAITLAYRVLAYWQHKLANVA